MLITLDIVVCLSKIICQFLLICFKVSTPKISDKTEKFLLNYSNLLWRPLYIQLQELFLVRHWICWWQNLCWCSYKLQQRLVCDFDEFPHMLADYLECCVEDDTEWVLTCPWLYIFKWPGPSTWAPGVFKGLSSVYMLSQWLFCCVNAFITGSVFVDTIVIIFVFIDCLVTTSGHRRLDQVIGHRSKRVGLLCDCRVFAELTFGVDRAEFHIMQCIKVGKSGDRKNGKKHSLLPLDLIKGTDGDFKCYLASCLRAVRVRISRPSTLFFLPAR